MNIILERICADMEKETQLLFNRNHIEELKFASFAVEDLELERRLTMLAARYLVEIEKKDKEIESMRAEIAKLNKLYRESYQQCGRTYKEVMENKKEIGLHPADKKISLKAISDLMEAGMSNKQICDMLSISRSTLWRKMKQIEALPKLPKNESQSIRLNL